MDLLQLVKTQKTYHPLSKLDLYITLIATTINSLATLAISRQIKRTINVICNRKG